MTTATKLLLTVAKDFSITPGPRYREDGEYSGEQFLADLLAPMYKEAQEQNTTLFIDLDGTAGYGTSFLEESFGGLARLFPSEDILKRIKIKTEDEPYQQEDIRRYIEEANDK